MRAQRPVQLRMAAAALALLVAIVAMLGTWQVMAARNSQRAEIEDGEMNAAHLASSALASALSSRLQLLSNLAGQPAGGTDLHGRDQGRAGQGGRRPAPSLPRLRQLRRHRRRRAVGGPLAGRPCLDRRERFL